MVPVLDKNNNPIMPCTEKRARQMMEKNKAKAYWQKGIFCIKLLSDSSDSKKQEVVLGIDPGSKREGYTVCTANSVVLNITTDTKFWISKHIERRKNLRAFRRYRKSPYRKSRLNRSSLKKNKIPPSIKSRWLTKINLIKNLLNIIPISIINIEDIKASLKKNKSKWNKIFSPLQNGKIFFEKEIQNLKIKLIKTIGFDTKIKRDLRGFKKSNEKMNYIWESHNIDSHILCEIILNKNIIPYKSLYKMNFMQFHRRQLHVQNPIKNGFRKKYGGTVSLGIPKGSVLLFKNKLCYMGGYSKSRYKNKEFVATVYSFLDKKIISKNVRENDIIVLYKSNKIVNLIKV